MEELDEQGKETYNQSGVLIHTQNAHHDEESMCSGTLSIMEYSYANCIEWKPAEAEQELSVEAVTHDQEWAVIHATVGYKLQNPETVEGLGSQRRAKHSLKVDVKDLKSFKVSKNNQLLTLMQKDGTTHNAFLFPLNNADCFICSLKKYVKVTRSRRDKRLFVIVDHQIEVLDKSFAELNLFQENTSDFVWKFVKNLQERPYETTLTTFSKLSDYMLFRQPQAVERRPEEEVAELLHRSLSSCDGQTDADGYEVITAPHPDIILPPRPAVSRGEPLSLEEWTALMDVDGRVLDEAEIKSKIFRGGVHPSLRYEVWKFLLGYFPFNSTHMQRQELHRKLVEEYFQVKLQWRTFTSGQESRFTEFRERRNLIDKDVYRTDRTFPFYEGENNANLQILNDILMTYVMYNFDLGYVQGMSDLLSPILYVMQNEVDAFWCFVGFMNKVNRNFDLDQSGMKQQLQQLNSLLHILDPELASYLESQESGNLYFCFRWLLVLFKREFSFSDVMRLWEVLWTGLPCPNFHLLLCLAILDTEKNTLLENKYGFTEILKHINDISLQIYLEETINKAEAIYHQLKSVSRLPANVAAILGIPVPPDVTEESTDCASNGVKEQRNGCKETEYSELSDTGDGAIEFLPEPDEDRFEAALSMQYL